jgi:DNA-binding GntR family transcriptional regulator
MQIWRTIAPHVRGHFHRDSRRHSSLHDTAQEHAELVRALQTRSEEEVLGVLDRHIHTTIELDRAVWGSTRDSAGT